MLEFLGPFSTLAVVVGGLAGAAVLGYWAGTHRRTVGAEQHTQVSVLVGALLGLLGLLLGFSFSITEARFSARRQLVLAEANAIGTTFLRAGMLPEPERARVRALLREYLQLRLSLKTVDELAETLDRSTRLHRALWSEAEAVGRREPESEQVALFVASLNNVIDLHETRVATSLYARLPRATLRTLLAVGALALGLIGYSAGLARARASIPMLIVIAAIGTTILLIVELDRPWGQLFQVGKQTLEDTRELIQAYP